MAQRSWQILLEVLLRKKNALRRLLFNSPDTDTPRMSPEKVTAIQQLKQSLLRQKLTSAERVLVILGTVGIPVILGIALLLTPDPKGFGTHQQLGMPPCTFRSLTGLNCPHCGITTSFCWFARGQWCQSIQTSPAGFILAAGLVLAWPWLLGVGVTGLRLGIQKPGKLFLLSSAGWLLLSLVLWVLRLIL
jgi:hypothetical protein